MITQYPRRVCVIVEQLCTAKCFSKSAPYVQLQSYGKLCHAHCETDVAITKASEPHSFVGLWTFRPQDVSPPSQ